MSAKEAYKSYVRAYDSHGLKDIFDVNTLDLNGVARSFGFTVPPFVDLRENIYSYNYIIQVSHKIQIFFYLASSGKPKIRRQKERMMKSKQMFKNKIFKQVKRP